MKPEERQGLYYTQLSGQFGTVDGTLPLTSGFHVVLAPNESGKSTWCALLRTLLYGIESGERVTKDNELPDKLRYAPWSGKPCTGSLTAVYGGREIRLTRATSPRAKAPFDEFSAVWTDTNTPVDGLHAETAGETLTGASESLFKRTLYCSAAQMAVTQTPDLERKIAALAGSGDEQMSESVILERLNAWKRERKGVRGAGRIPQLDAEIAQLSQELAAVESINSGMLADQDALYAAERRIAALERDLAVFAARESREQHAALIEAETEAAAAQAAVEAHRRGNGITGARLDREAVRHAEEQVRQAAGIEADIHHAERERDFARREAQVALPPELQYFQGLTAEGAQEMAAADQTEAAAARSVRKAWRWLIPAVLCGAAAGILSLLLPAGAGYRPLCIAAAATLAAACAAIFGWRLFGAASSRKRAAELCKKYGVRDANDIPQTVARYQAYLKHCRTLRVAADDAEEKLLQLCNSLRFKQEAASRALAQLDISPDEAPLAALAQLGRLLDTDDVLVRREQSAAARAEGLRKGMQGAEAPDSTENNPAEADTAYPTKAETAYALSEARAAREQAALSVASQRGQLKQYRDMAALAAACAEKEKERAQLETEWQAMERAQSWIREEADILAQAMTPRMQKRTEELFFYLTRDRYSAVRLDRNFRAMVCPAGDTAERKMAALSSGALDQLYFAVRLALSELLYTPPYPPLILDDCLGQYDDGRVEQTAALLRALAAQRQIILFTCRRREAEAAARHGAVVTELP